MAQNVKMVDRRMVFGVCGDVHSGVHYLDENNIVWVAGKSLVLLDTQLGSQQLLSCTQSCERVTAMALAPSRRLLAVAEGGKTPSVVVYLFDAQSTPRLKRRAVLHFPDVGSTEYVSLSFSQDGRYLVALGGFPEWKLIYWDVEKHRILAHCPALQNAVVAKDANHLNQCTIAPHDANLICVTGRGLVKFFRYNDGHMAAVEETGVADEQVHYLAHTWLFGEEGRLVASTSNGDLHLFDRQVYKHPLPLSPSDGIAINALVSYSKGFACGGDMGLITIFEHTRSKEMYRKVRTFRFTPDGSSGTAADAPASSKMGAEIPTILSFTLTPPPAEEFLAFLTSTKQIYCLNLPNADFTKAEDMVFQPVGQPFHTGDVVDVDTCAQRPLVVTAGRDGSIFLWNCITNVMEMRKRLDDEILSVALHPSGLHLLVGCADSLRLLNIYDSDLCEYRRFSIRACAACTFSHGGQYFAVANSTTIHVYYTYTGELLGHLRGHNGKVRSISFVPPDDTRLVSCGADGAVFEFSLCDFHKVHDYSTKAVTFNCAAADVATVWAAGNDRKLRQLERATLSQGVEYDLNTASMRCMMLSQSLKLLFGGCEDGTIRVFNTYLGEKVNGRSGARTGDAGLEVAQRGITVESHGMHTGVVSKLAMTYDEGMLVSVGEDGVVVFWDIVAPHRGTAKELEYTTELLVDHRELDASVKLVQTLATQVADLSQQMAQQQLKHERQHEEQISRLEREYSEEVRKQKEEMNALESQKSEQAIRFTEHMSELERKATQTLSRTEEDYTTKVEALESRSTKLQKLIQEERGSHERNVANIQEEAAARRREVKDRQQKELEQLEEEQHQVALEKERNDAETEAMCTMIEEDNDDEIVKSKEQYEKHRREHEEELATIQAANHALLSRENLTRAELEAKMADITEKLRQQAVLESQIDGAKRDIEALTHELRERGETIGAKDRRIQDLKTKNQELEKFKFVLEYKIKELKTQIEPKDEEIRVARERLAHMEAETGQYLEGNEHLVLEIKSLRQKRAAQQKELAALETKQQAAEEFQARMWANITDVYQSVLNKDKKQLKGMAKLLHDTYTSGRGASNSKAFTSSRTAADEVKDYNRERDHLERNLASLKKKVAKDEENNRAEKHRITSENVVLVREVNQLRKEARTLAGKAGLLQGTDAAGKSVYEEEYAREVEVQKSEITRLRNLVMEMEAQLKSLGIPLPTSTAAA